MQRGPEERILLLQEMHDQRVNAVLHRPHAVCPSLLTSCQGCRKALKTGANSRGLKYRSAQFLLGRNAIDKGAKSICFQEPVQSLSARSKEANRDGRQDATRSRAWLFPCAAWRGGPRQGVCKAQERPSSRLRAFHAFHVHKQAPCRL